VHGDDLAALAQQRDSAPYRNAGDAVLNGELGFAGQPGVRGEPPGFDVSFDVGGDLDGYRRGRVMPRYPRPRQDRMTHLPIPEAAAWITAFLSEHLCWSAFWDKQEGVWRVAEDDPDSDLYAESPDANAIIAYMKAHGLHEAH
jgi:hypothetical protein